MKEVAIIIPVGPDHFGVAERAVRSAKAQTTPCDVVVIEDREKRGPSWARNAGRRHAPDARRLVFLDADDELHEAFVAECLKVARPNQYIYTDFVNEAGRRFAPPPAGEIYCFCPKPFTARFPNFHPVTTLFPAAAFDAIGGFDEALTDGGEDKAFYTAANMTGCCGAHLRLPLFRYNRSPNSRGARWVVNDEKQRWLHRRLSKLYGGLMSPCRNCGGRTAAKKNTPPLQKANVNRDGSIGRPGGTHDFRLRGGRIEVIQFDCLAQYLRQVSAEPRGRSTGFNYGRHYGRKIAFPNMVWIDRRDAVRAPGEWLIVQELRQPSGAPTPPEQIAEQALGSGPVARQPAGEKPDFAFVVEAGQRGLENKGVFW